MLTSKYVCSAAMCNNKGPPRSNPCCSPQICATCQESCKTRNLSAGVHRTSEVEPKTVHFLTLHSMQQLDRQDHLLHLHRLKADEEASDDEESFRKKQCHRQARDRRALQPLVLGTLPDRGIEQR